MTYISRSSFITTTGEILFVRLKNMCIDYKKERISQDNWFETRLVFGYACLHSAEKQKVQTVLEINYATEMMHNIVDIKTFTASNYFDVANGGSCHEKSTVQIAYYLYGYVYDQLVYLKYNGKYFLDSHPGNVFVLNDYFYWGEYGSHLETLLDPSDEVDISLKNSLDSTMRMFKYFLEDCNITAGDSFWLVRNVSVAIDNYYGTTTELSPVNLFKVIEDVICRQVFLFPQEVQEQFHIKVGPQVQSKILTLYSDIATLKIMVEQLKSQDEHFKNTTDYLEAQLKSHDEQLKSNKKTTESLEAQLKSNGKTTESLEAQLKSQDEHHKNTTDYLEAQLKSQDEQLKSNKKTTESLEAQLKSNNNVTEYLQKTMEEFMKKQSQAQNVTPWMLSISVLIIVTIFTVYYIFKSPQ